MGWVGLGGEVEAGRLGRGPGGGRVAIDGGQKEERCISGLEIAVVYSSTNPKFCADPTVARKQLTVKWGGSKGLVCPV